MRYLLFLCGVLFSALLQAEITEIPTQELTDSYIRDTTIIVQKKAPTVFKKDNLYIKVNAKPYSSAQSIEQQDLILKPQEKTNINTEIKLESPANYQFLTQQQATSYDHQKHQREKDIRKKYNIPYNKPLDLNTLSLPLSENGKYNLGTGKSYQVTKRALEIRIPNTKGFNAQAIKTQDGTYDVQVTPTDVIFKFNLK